MISDRRNKKKPYNINASQKPPIIFNISVMTEEFLDSRIFAKMKRAARKKKEIAYISRWL
jgi:hypothetical protein